MMALEAQQYTRGIGVYSGDPKEDFSPVLRQDSTYRNLALHRAAFHSSSYDYNLTAQLVTDGIKDTVLPRWVAIANNQDGPLSKYPSLPMSIKGQQGWVQIGLLGGDGPLEVDRVGLNAQVRPNASAPAGWTCIVSGSDDGQTWTELGRAQSTERPAPEFTPSIPLATPSRNRYFRVEFQAASVKLWQVGEIVLSDQGKRVDAAGPYRFTSAWMSAGAGEEWVYVDLGATCEFDKVALAWIRPAAEGQIQVSGDAKTWETLQALPSGAKLNEEIKLARPAKGRYVRVLMTKPASPEGYILSELEVYGRGGFVARPKPALAARADGRLDLAGGAWRLERDSLAPAGGAAFSTAGFDDKGWVVATVPGTILASYYNVGALADPNFGDNQLMISDSFFYADFWYRNEFTAPPASAGRRQWLNLDGVNWKAEVWLNGEKIGRVDGGFMRGRFDVTGRLRPGAKNAIAIRVEKNATPGTVKEKTFQVPGKNGGALGADNPTYHASIGWDWMPTIRGRDTGIWNRVYLTTSGPVTIENPFVSTTLPLPDISQADVKIEATLRNSGASPVTGKLQGRFGDVAFELPVTLDASSAKTVTLDPSTHPALRLVKPRLWWPNGYGDPNLYPVDLKFVAAGKAGSDEKQFQAGVRQFTYSEDGGALRIWINGRRFVGRGGNWGFSESMLRYRAREYDAAVRYHRDMNFTMIRNWVGQIGEDEFYDACDRYGIVVWQDFWLANPADGPDPDDNALFLANARDTILRIRNHASIGLYCGRNEGFPPKPIEDGLRAALNELHPGLNYIPSSADQVVGGHGPYRAMPVEYYFKERATKLLHSELGMPNIVTLDSVKAMMKESDMWPQGRLWGLHDFCLSGAQGASSFREKIEKSYGGAKDAAEWVSLAQFVNYDGYRAMFEAQGKNRMGLLLWMSHPAWPSFVWETYDYYFDQSAAYFGAKKASEPLHIQWNPLTDDVEVVNYSAGDLTDLSAAIEVMNPDGTRLWTKSAQLDSREDSVAAPIHIEYPAGLAPVHFLRLKLTRKQKVVSENFYWRAKEPDNFLALRELPKVKLETSTHVRREGGRWLLTTELRNETKSPALMVRVKAVREKSGDRILPALYSDNYVALMPGEKRNIETELRDADTRGEKPAITVDGFNVE